MKLCQGTMATLKSQLTCQLNIIIILFLPHLIFAQLSFDIFLPGPGEATHSELLGMRRVSS